MSKTFKNIENYFVLQLNHELWVFLSYIFEDWGETWALSSVSRGKVGEVSPKGSLAHESVPRGQGRRGRWWVFAQVSAPTRV